MKRITVRELLAMDIDVDVCDDVDESLYIAFVGPLQLSQWGKIEFAGALDLEVTLPPDDNDFYDHVCVHVDHPDEKIWRRNLCEARHLFESAAGYCAYDEYNMWFIG